MKFTNTGLVGSQDNLVSQRSYVTELITLLRGLLQYKTLCGLITIVLFSFDFFIVSNK